MSGYGLNLISAVSEKIRCDYLRMKALYFTLVLFQLLNSVKLESKGRIKFATPLQSWVTASCKNLNLITAKFSHEIALRAYQLKELHSDPADRVLTATAQVEKLTLVTADRRLLSFSDIKTQAAEK